jgi:hypothetical protein
MGKVFAHRVLTHPLKPLQLCTYIHLSAREPLRSLLSPSQTWPKERLYRPLKSSVLYRGTTLVVPKTIENMSGFSVQRC